MAWVEPSACAPELHTTKLRIGMGHPLSLFNIKTVSSYKTNTVPLTTIIAETLFFFL